MEQNYKKTDDSKNLKVSHTPAPWTYVATSDLVYAECNQMCVAVVRENSDVRPSFLQDKDVIKANAKLIASAPELLKSLIELNQAIDDYWNSETKPDILIRHINMKQQQVKQLTNKLTAMKRLIATIRINNGTSNPIAVECVISASYEYGPGWEWSIEEIKSVELVIGDKEGIDITNKLSARAKALLTAQIADEDDQIIDALTESEDENPVIDQTIYNKAS